jgi:hypothetical protein
VEQVEAVVDHSGFVEQAEQAEPVVEPLFVGQVEQAEPVIKPLFVV